MDLQRALRFDNRANLETLAALRSGNAPSQAMPRCFLEYTVPLDELRSEDETELIEGKHRGSIAAPKERKNARRDLGHN